MHVCLLTGRVDEVTEDSQGAHSTALIAVLQLLKNKHNQPVWEGVCLKERSQRVRVKCDEKPERTYRKRGKSRKD